jgi:hypothetical protein
MDAVVLSVSDSGSLGWGHQFKCSGGEWTSLNSGSVEWGNSGQQLGNVKFRESNHLSLLVLGRSGELYLNGHGVAS